MFANTTTYDPALAELGAALKVSAVPATSAPAPTGPRAGS